MPTIGYRLLAAVLALTLLAAAGEPPSAVLRRGINITNWFRFPPSRDPAMLRAYLSDTALAGLQPSLHSPRNGGIARDLRDIVLSKSWSYWPEDHPGHGNAPRLSAVPFTNQRRRMDMAIVFATAWAIVILLAGALC
jgi:hypothetical protein